MLAAAAVVVGVVLLATVALSSGDDDDPRHQRDGCGAEPTGGRFARGAGALRRTPRSRRPDVAEVEWRESTALGSPMGGELVRGVQVPREGRHFFTWDPVERTSPNRPWRRWGTDQAIRVTLQVLADHRREHPGAPRLGIGDLSRPHGGDFGTDYGPIGHVSHQNGLDVDVYYPLESERERAPLSVAEVDLGLSQDLVDRFVAAGADRVFVGPGTGLTGPPEVVQAAANHDNHLHVRFQAEG